MIHTCLKLRLFALENDRTRHRPTQLEDFAFRVPPADNHASGSDEERLVDAQRIINQARKYLEAA